MQRLRFGLALRDGAARKSDMWQNKLTLLDLGLDRNRNNIDIQMMMQMADQMGGAKEAKPKRVDHRTVSVAVFRHFIQKQTMAYKEANPLMFVRIIALPTARVMNTNNSRCSPWEDKKQ